jgi:solute carrier family 25 (mitochondrial 2-oxodicarboxylate transporter), member 21
MRQKSEDPQVLYIAGALSGISEALAVQPFDMVKTRHQLNPGNNLSVTGTLSAIYREGGIARFYRGMTPELYVESFLRSSYFADCYNYFTRPLG